MNHDSLIRQKLINDYWVNKLTRPGTVTFHPGREKSPVIQTFSFEIENGIVNYVNEISGNNIFSEYAIYLSFFSVLLHKHFSKDDILIVTSDIKPGRKKYKRDHLSFFRIILDDRLTLFELFKVTGTELQQTYNNLDVDLSLLENTYDNFTVRKEEYFDFGFYSNTINENSAYLDSCKLQMSFARSGSGTVICEFKYHDHLFSAEFIKILALQYGEGISSIKDNLTISVGAIKILSETERNYLADFNSTQVPYPDEGTIVNLFYQQVRATPHHVAVVYDDSVLTYDELSKQSDLLAQCLRQKFNLRKGVVVGLLTGRNEQMLIGMLGILKAGGAYLPLEMNYPVGRLHKILDDANVRVVIGYARDLVSDYSCIDLNKEDLTGYFPTDADNDIKANDLVYVIYTSGSTGSPKGVLIEHRGLVNLSLWHQQTFKVTDASRSAVYAAMSFDAMGWEIWPYLLKGASIHILTEEQKLNLDGLVSFLSHAKITHSFLPTGVWEALEKDKLDDSIVMLTGGDKLRNLTPRMIVNNYGPTEATVVATSVSLTAESNTKNRSIPIGSPIRNTQLYILDSHLELVPIGIEGEIYIGGVGLSRGYLNQPELTAERFVKNPFDPESKLYRTGDRGRWGVDGTIEYLGRKDHQVKIRGYRIELGEIEHALRQLADVEQALVIARLNEQKNEQLIAYVCGEQVQVSELRHQLMEKLPEYMMPVHFVKVDAFPLTVNGKIDTKALPEPQHQTITYVAARTPAEQHLVKIWEEVLSRKTVSITDNFFAIGGDSIKAMQVAARMHQAGYKLEVRQLLQQPILTQLALECIASSESIIGQQAVEGEVALTPIQHYFFTQKSPVGNHFNQSLLLMGGNLLKPIIAGVFQKIVEHHDALRMVFNFEAEKITQINNRVSGEIGVKEFDYRNIVSHLAVEQMNEEADKIQRSIDLEAGPLIRIALFHLPASDCILIVIHHLVVDGVSWRILLEDLGLLIEQYRQGKDLVLPPKTHSYQYWAAQVGKWATSEAFHNQQLYWMSKEKGSKNIIRLVPDNNVSGNYVGDTSSKSVALNEQETLQLLTSAHHAYNTEINDLLLTALSVSLQRVWGGEQALIGMEGHGREHISEGIDVTRTIGWFTTIYPVVLEVNKDQSLGNQLIDVKEQLRRVPMKGMGYGVVRYLTKSAYEWKLFPQLRFNYLGQFDTEIKNSGLQVMSGSKGKSISDQWERDCDWDVTAIVSERKLYISLEFNHQQYHSRRIEDFLAVYQQVLRDLIAHCVNQTEEQVTPSDLGAAELTMEELDKLFD